jgi:hypothetical protein
MFIFLTNPTFLDKFLDVITHTLPKEIGPSTMEGLMIPGVACSQILVDEF